MNKIIINISGKEINATLNKTKTAVKIFHKLPVSSTINRWGDEIYFDIPVDSGLEDGVEILEVGSIAFWPPGNAFCVFFGPTPASMDERPRAAGPVNIIGSIDNNKEIEFLRSLSSGQKVTIFTNKKNE